jgi:pterin-4a-carbinolamine dehydratase
MLANAAPFATIVILLVWMGFFMLGSLPLMILKHDTPLDARFIRGLFDVYYKAVMVVAALGVIAHALVHRPVITLVMAGVGVIAMVSRRVVLVHMDRLRATMTATDAASIRSFRRWHVLGMALNVAQLLAICASLPFVL